MTILFILLAVLALVAILILLVSVNIEVVREEGKPIREFKLTEVEQLKRGQLTVYFSPEHRALAEEVAQALEQGWRIVRERLGLDLGRFKVVVVVPKEGEEVGGVRWQRKIWALWDMIAPILTSPNLQSLQQADKDTLIQVYWVMVHEAMELKVAKKFYHDRAARWIGDGLAEYAGYAVTSELAPRLCDEMLAGRRRNVQSSLLDQGRQQYDLTKEFPVKMGLKKVKETKVPEQKPASVTADPGYGVALAFWLQIAQKHSSDVIKTFWQQISKRGFPNAKESARILSELTGEDIWTKLQNMDLHEVLRTLERAAGP